VAGLFQNILIPVDLTINTDVAVKKAMELAENNSMVHLLYVQNFAFPGIAGIAKKHCVRTNELPGNTFIEKSLNLWKNKIEESTNNITVHTWNILADSIQRTIEIKAKQLAVDLIIIGKKSHHSWLPFLNTVVPSQVARKTGITVITVKPGSINNKMKTVVLPISSESVKHKMEVIADISRKYRIKVYLVIIMDRGTESENLYSSTLLQLYQWLNTIGCPVEYAVLSGHNKAKAILNYAERINADILLLEPETETRIGWPNKHISDVLPFESKLQVWAV